MAGKNISKNVNNKRKITKNVENKNEIDLLNKIIQYINGFISIDENVKIQFLFYFIIIGIEIKI